MKHILIDITSNRAERERLHVEDWNESILGGLISAGMTGSQCALEAEGSFARSQSNKITMARGATVRSRAYYRAALTTTRVTRCASGGLAIVGIAMETRSILYHIDRRVSIGQTRYKIRTLQEQWNDYKEERDRLMLECVEKYP